MALYNKYRPKKLSQLCGQEHVKKILTSQLEKDELVHAYLFTGPAGTGDGPTGCSKRPAIPSIVF